MHPVEFAPQNDLLGHPAVQIFITQGGANSLYEVWMALAELHQLLRLMHPAQMHDEQESNTSVRTCHLDEQERIF